MIERIQINAFDGNSAEAKTILSVVHAFEAAYGFQRSRWSPMPASCRSPTSEVVDDAGLSFIVGMRIADADLEPTVGRREAARPWRQSVVGELSVQARRPRPGPTTSSVASLVNVTNLARAELRQSAVHSLSVPYCCLCVSW
jgi:hypothetical protein